MSNKHTNHQHGLTSMNATRPKSKMWKRRNKAAAKGRKELLLKALNDAVSVKKGTPAKAAKAPKKVKTAKVQKAAKIAKTEKATKTTATKKEA